MSDDLSRYLVIKCSDCNFFFGKPKKSKFYCPRCGEIQSKSQIFGRANTTEELLELVSLNNIPEELRDDFSKLNKKIDLNIPPQNIKELIPLILSELANDEGIIKLVDLDVSIRKNKYGIDSEKIIEIAESEGLLLRVSKEKWQLLG